MMIDQLAKTDEENVTLKRTAGHHFFACDERAQDLVRSPENLGKIDLSLFKLKEIFESLLRIRAQQSPTELIRREVEMVAEVYNYSCRASQSSSNFENKFKV